MKDALEGSKALYSRSNLLVAHFSLMGSSLMSSKLTVAKPGRFLRVACFKTVLRSDALEPFQVAYVNFRYLQIKIKNVRLEGQCVIGAL